jgi:hypothetical protein
LCSEREPPVRRPIYSFDIAIQGKSGIQETEVDAGNGKVLSNKHESAAAEAAQKAKDKA